jgi:DNA polymerase III subunit beta
MEGTFTINQKELLPILMSVQPICNKRTTLEATESILFQMSPREIILKATDLEVSLQSNLTVETSFEGTEMLLVSGKRIFDVIKEMEGDIKFNVTSQSLNILSGNVDITLNIRDAQDFPPFPERIENLIEIDAQHFLSMLSKVAMLIPQNNANPALNGMLFELGENIMSMVATDGHSLIKIETDKYSLSETKSWLLPKRTVMELKKLLESIKDGVEKIFLGTCGQQLVFSGKNFNFFTRLIVDSFPQYKPVLEKEGFYPAKLDRNHFIKTLKRTACLLAGQFIATSFVFNEKEVSVNLHNKEVGKIDEAIAIEDFSGQKTTTKLYSPYLLNGLQGFSSDEKLNFFIKNSSRPIIFESHNKYFEMTYLVMPVSPSNQ